MGNTPILSQQTRNKRTLTSVSEPDTDSRYIELNKMGLSVTPDLMHDHTRMKYTAPIGSTPEVRFYSPKNKEERSLHILELDNSNNTFTKNFKFDPDYIFLDDLNNATNEYTVLAGGKLVWFGTIKNGKVYLRLSSESTN